MGFSIRRCWADSLSLVRERWVDLAIVTLTIHVVGFAAMWPFLSDWSLLFQPAAADPDAQLARMAEIMPRVMGLSMLSYLVQIAGWGAMVALLGPDRPDLAKALSEGLKATPSLLVAFIFLLIGFYVGLIVIVAVAAALIAGLTATQGDPSLAAGGAFVVVFLLVYFGTIAGVLYLAARFVALVPVVVLEHEYNPFGVLKRAWRLTRGHGWKIVGLFVLLWLPIAFVMVALVLTFMPSLSSVASEPPILESFMPLWMAFIPINIILTMILSAVIVAIHCQLGEEPPAEPA